MGNVTTHITNTSIALALGLATLMFTVETFLEYELTFRILIYSGVCCLVGGCAPDIDHQNSVPAIVLWSLLLLVMCAGFLKIYFGYIVMLLPELSSLGSGLLMYSGVLVLIPLANIIFEEFQVRTTHRKILHRLLKTGIFTATLAVFILPFSYQYGGIDLVIERSLYLASFQYGVVLHILLDKSKIVRFLAV